MRKFSLYALLAATLLITGCSQKTVEMDQNNNASSMNQNSESALDNMNASQDANMIEEENLAVDGKGNYFVVNGEKVFVESIYFGFDKYTITEDQRAIASNNASKLQGLDGSIKVEGNCDEWGTDEYNYALGLKRAKAVKNVLENNGVEANISLVSLGESNPVCTEKNKNCWSKNRRVEHTLVK